jgi:hypothetical protein
MHLDDRAMATDSLPTGPDSEAITRTIRRPGPTPTSSKLLGAMHASLDPEKHCFLFATIVTTDEHDEVPRTWRSLHVFRLNIGVSREIERLVE